MNLYDIAIARKLSGGGGSSDLTTATVNITGEESITLFIHGAIIGESSSFGNGDFASGDIINVILYKGSADIYIEADTTLTVSGNITDEGYNTYIVTGDCTITIS